MVREIPLISVAQPAAQLDPGREPDFSLCTSARANPEPRGAERDLLAGHQSGVSRETRGDVSDFRRDAHERTRHLYVDRELSLRATRCVAEQLAPLDGFIVREKILSSDRSRL